MEDLKGKTSYGWVELTDMVSDPTDLTTGRGGIALVGTALKYYNKTEWVTLEAGESTNHKLLSATHTDTTAGDVARGDIITGQGSTAKWTRLAKGTAGQLLTMGEAEPGWATLSGVANANIAANAAIAWSKMATSTDIHTDGTVKALSIGSPNAGDVLRYVGSAWTVVDPATLPGGTASGLAQNVTIEAGTYDLTLKTTVQTSSAADLTIPDFAGENQTIALIGLAQTLTNKTIDCDGAGNVITNIGATELKNVADAGMGVPFIVRKTLTDLPQAGTNVLGTTHPKLRVIDVWFVATSADSGTVQLKVGQVGSIGAEITDEISIAADKGISRAGELNDAAWEVAANTGMVAVGDEGGSVDGELFVMAIRVA